MLLHRALAEVQPAGDLRVRVARRDERRHLALPGAQRRQRPVAVVRPWRGTDDRTRTVAEAAQQAQRLVARTDRAKPLQVGGRSAQLCTGRIGVTTGYACP